MDLGMLIAALALTIAYSFGEKATPCRILILSLL